MSAGGGVQRDERCNQVISLVSYGTGLSGTSLFATSGAGCGSTASSSLTKRLDVVNVRSSVALQQ